MKIIICILLIFSFHFSLTLKIIRNKKAFLELSDKQHYDSESFGLATNGGFYLPENAV